MLRSFSVDQLKTWTKCQKRYELHYARKLSWPSNPRNFRLGMAVHQLLDFHSRNLPLDPLLTHTDSDIREAWQSLVASRWPSLPVVASEWGFSLEIEGDWIYGRVDRIAQDGDQIHILDWKTGTGIPLSPETDWQTLVYLYAVYEARHDMGLAFTPEQLSFVYVQVKRNAIREARIPYSQALHENTAVRLTQALRRIKATQEFMLPDKCPDRYCAYGNICGINAIPEMSSETPALALSESETL